MEHIDECGGGGLGTGVNTKIESKPSMLTPGRRQVHGEAQRGVFGLSTCCLLACRETRWVLPDLERDRQGELLVSLRSGSWDSSPATTCQLRGMEWRHLVEKAGNQKITTKGNMAGGMGLHLGRSGHREGTVRGFPLLKETDCGSPEGTGVASLI